MVPNSSSASNEAMGLAAEPRILHGERIGPNAVQGLVFAGVDLDLQLGLGRRRRLGREAEDQVNRMSRRLAAAWPEPGEGTANSIDRLADRFGTDLDEVDVLRVSERLTEEELVDGGAATECEALGEVRFVEDIAQGATDDEVLFDLTGVRPWRRRGPLLDIGGGNHASISSGTFRLSFQAGASGAWRAREPATMQRTGRAV